MHTVCDIPEDFESVRKEYTGKIPQLDLSEMKESQPWYIYDLQEPVRSKLLEQCKNESKTHKAHVLGEIL